MKFKRIKVKNIRSYKDQEMEFPEGSLLLSGDVGAGKTSLLLAIEYALFGLQPGQKGSSLLRNNEQIGEVVLELEASKKPIIIERKLKRTSKGVSNEYAAITIDGEKEEASLTEIKLKIVNLLGYPQEFVKKNNVLYRYTVYTQQEQMKQIILEDSETRLNVLRNIFGIDKYKQIKSNLSILLANLKTNSKILQGKISTLDQEKEGLKLRKINLAGVAENIVSQEKELLIKTQLRRKLELNLEELKKKIDEKRGFEREIEKTNILILTKKEIISPLSKELLELKKFISEAGKSFSELEYRSLLKEIKSKKENSENLNSQYLEITGKINFLRQQENEVLSKKERIFKIDICPTCLQDVSENHKHNILSEAETKISKIKQDLELLEKQQKEIIQVTTLQKKEVFELEEKKLFLEILKSKLEQIEKSKTKIQDLEKQKQNLENDETMLVSHIKGLKEKILQYSVFENQLKLKENELNQSLLGEKKIEILLAELKKESEIAKKEILLLEESIKKKEESKEKLHRLNELTDWLSTKFLSLIELTERQVLMKLRSEFSSLFRKWFLMLISENSLDSQIDENFTPVIMQGDVEMEYSFLSGGERTAVALAYRLALNQTINSFMSKIKTKGIIILDEPTDGFSDAQIDKVRDILEELNTEQLIIVSHEQKIEGFVDNVFKVIKEGDISALESTTPQSLNT